MISLFEISDLLLRLFMKRNSHVSLIFEGKKM